MEFKPYTTVLAFVRDHLSMQFGDVRSMLHLPLPSHGITYACNFAATATLCNLISGISVSLYQPANPIKINKKGKREWIGSGECFKRLLQEFYPWEPTDNGSARSKALYDLFRNPFVHALGVHGRQHNIEIRRLLNPGSGHALHGLQAQQLEEIERAPIRPPWLPAGLSGSGTQWTLNTDGFYRDVLQMLLALARDQKQMLRAEARFSTHQLIWTKGQP